MTRNRLIEQTTEQITFAIHAATSLPFGAPDSDHRRAWARVEELKRFCNDLTNVPSARNRRLGIVCYTMREVTRRYRELTGPKQGEEKMKQSNWFVAQNGRQTDIYVHVIPDSESPRTLTVAANLNPDLAKAIVDMRNDFDARLTRIEVALLHITQGGKGR